MINLTEKTDSNVLVLTAHGKVTDDDYEKILIPAVEAKIAQFGNIRLLYQLGEDFDGYEAEAAWEDTKLGMHHLSSFEKIAVVTDVKSIRGGVKAFGFLMHGEVKLFHNDEMEAALAWINA